MTTPIHQPAAGGVVPSLIRTYTPIAVGALVTYLARTWGVVIDDHASADLTLGVGGIAMALYYTLLRVAEAKVPALGWLLGVAKQPAYSPAAGALVGPSRVINGQLGRVRQFDVRSADYPIRALVGKETPRSYTWPCAVVLDQGQEGSCVGHGITHELIARPVVVDGDHELALAIYHLAQQLDDTPGENYSGTSVLAGMKAATRMGYYAEYRWAFGLEDLVLAIGHHGPAVLGLDWYQGMFNSDADGFLNVTGAVEGGHCILARSVRLVKSLPASTSVGAGALAGIDLDRSYVTLHNSWGPSWGALGTARIRLVDLDRLLKAGGEAAIPVVRKQAA